MKPLPCFALLTATCIALPAAAQDDGQAWGSVTATTAFSDKVDATMEVHLRFTDDAGRLGQTLLRPSLTYKLDHGFSLAAGYVYVRTNPVGPALSDEHRTWQQIGYRFVQNEGIVLTGRTRLEQRFVEGGSGTGWRVRQQVRGALPVQRGSKVQAILWNETFIGLNDTAWGQRADFDQSRTFVGVGLPVAERTTVEIGYLNQHIFRRGPDRDNHILAVNLFTRF